MKRICAVWGLALALALWVPPAAPALAARGSAEVLLAQGLTTQTPLRIDDSGRDGPTLLFVAGTHGNEIAGFAAAEELMAEIFPAAGKILWIPRANAQAIARDARTGPDGEDLNRAYPGDAQGSDIERLAREIMDLIEREQPAAVIDMHEGRNFYGQDGSIGNSVILGATEGSFANGLELLGLVNAQNGDLPAFTFDANAPTGSLNHETSTRLGIDTYTIETAQVLDEEVRVAQQKRFVRALLQLYGVPVEEE